MKKNERKKKIDRIVKTVAILLKLILVAVAVYAVYKRIGEIKNLEFFFTTWR